MKIFDAKEAREPFCAEMSATYWLESTNKSPGKAGVKASESIKELVGLESKDQLILDYHKLHGAKKLFQAILEQKISESGKLQILVDKDLDPSIQEMIDSLSESGCMKIILPTNEKGQIDIEETKKLLTYKSALMSFSYTNPKTGVIQPALELSNLCKEKNILLHLDLDEAVGPYFLDFKTLSCDFATISANTFFGPVASSITAIRHKALDTLKHSPIDANLLLNTAKAADAFMTCSKEKLMQIARMRRILESRMVQELSATILFEKQPRSPNFSLIQIPNCNHETLSFFLASKGILCGFNTELNCLSLYICIHTSYEDLEELTQAILLMGKKVQEIRMCRANAI